MWENAHRSLEQVAQRNKDLLTDKPHSFSLVTPYGLPKDGRNTQGFKNATPESTSTLLPRITSQSCHSWTTSGWCSPHHTTYTTWQRKTTRLPGQEYPEFVCAKMGICGPSSSGRATVLSNNFGFQHTMFSTPWSAKNSKPSTKNDQALTPQVDQERVQRLSNISARIHLTRNSTFQNTAQPATMAAHSTGMFTLSLVLIMHTCFQ